MIAFMLLIQIPLQWGESLLSPFPVVWSKCIMQNISPVEHIVVCCWILWWFLGTKKDTTEIRLLQWKTNTACLWVCLCFLGVSWKKYSFPQNFISKPISIVLLYFSLLWTCMPKLTGADFVFSLIEFDLYHWSWLQSHVWHSTVQWLPVLTPYL